MKILPTISLALALSASAASAPLSSQNIVVTPVPSHEEFVETVTRDLNDQLTSAARLSGDLSGKGITIVRFRRDSEGKPDDVSLIRRSGRSSLDHIALRAVRRLRSLDMVPSGVEDDQIFQANIIFAESKGQLARLSEKLAKEENARLASSRKERRVFALGSVPSRPTS